MADDLNNLGLTILRLQGQNKGKINFNFRSCGSAWVEDKLKFMVSARGKAIGGHSTASPAKQEHVDGVVVVQRSIIHKSLGTNNISFSVHLYLQVKTKRFTIGHGQRFGLILRMNCLGVLVSSEGKAININNGLNGGKRSDNIGNQINFLSGGLGVLIMSKNHGQLTILEMGGHLHGVVEIILLFNTSGNNFHGDWANSTNIASQRRRSLGGHFKVDGRNNSRAFNFKFSLDRQNSRHVQFKDDGEAHIRRNDNFNRGPVVNLDKVQRSLSTDLFLVSHGVFNSLLNLFSNRSDVFRFNTIHNLNITKDSRPDTSMEGSFIHGLALQRQLGDDLFPFLARLLFSRAENLADLIGEIHSSHIRAELKGGKLNLLQEVFNLTIEVLQSLRDSMGILDMIANLKTLEPFSSKVVQSIGESSRNSLGHANDLPSLV